MLKKYLYIFFISMVPLIELRGAIPVSQILSLPLIPSYMVCILGNMLPVPDHLSVCTKSIRVGRR